MTTTCGGCTETYAGPTCPRCATRAIQLPPLPRAAEGPVGGPLPGAAVPPPAPEQWVPAQQSWAPAPQQWAPAPQQWAPAPQQWAPAAHAEPQPPVPPAGPASGDAWMHWAPQQPAVPPPAATSGATAASSPQRPEFGEARFVGDARPIAGIPLSRIFNAVCYVIAGIAMLVISAQPSVPPLWPLVFGLLALAYGVKILVTRGSYWVHSLVYVIAIGAVVAMFATLGH